MMIFADGPWWGEWHHIPYIAGGIGSLILWWKMRKQ